MNFETHLGRFLFSLMIVAGVVLIALNIASPNVDSGEGHELNCVIAGCVLIALGLWAMIVNLLSVVEAKK